MARRVLKRAQEEKLTRNLSAQKPFGTQSLWSSLLVEREHLESEIKHAKIFLEQLRKDVVSSQPGRSSEHVQGQQVSGKNTPAAVRSALDKHSLEQSVLMWLDGLHARLDHITAEAEKLLAEGEQQSESPDESLFTLLRGAG
jgi:hypothetical protein